MLMATIKDALEILGYGNAENWNPQIFGIVQKLKRIDEESK
jgi:hypothetical protein